MPEDAIDLSSLAGDPTDEKVSPEELAALLEGYKQNQAGSALELACAGGLKVVDIPATFTLDNGRVFIVDNFRAWGWTPYGVLMIGRYNDDEADTERYVQVHGERIEDIELDVVAYEDEAKRQAEEPDEADEPEVEEPSGDSAAESSSD